MELSTYGSCVINSNNAAINNTTSIANHFVVISVDFMDDI